ncbi:hypothetical protein AVEN_126804-1 [Araneus ventricosus]|uniref:Uncharacterized protein n=1 Tax=Araneus ventricosus TaxID=182803 RepID=A0A4Y2RIL4_ARAVE|nr:hypothetical protein AVEN_126804-1 [Araneus ventricosus]
MDLVILNPGQMKRRAPDLVPPSPNFRATPTGGCLATTFYLTYNRPHIRPNFNGIGFRLEPSGPVAEAIPLGHQGKKATIVSMTLKQIQSLQPLLKQPLMLKA